MENERIIFSLERNGITVFRVIYTKSNKTVSGQILQNGFVTVENILSTEQAVAMAKSILNSVEEQ